MTDPRLEEADRRNVGARKTIWATPEMRANLRTLARRWGLSDSATIAQALKLALEDRST